MTFRFLTPTAGPLPALAATAAAAAPGATATQPIAPPSWAWAEQLLGMAPGADARAGAGAAAAAIAPIFPTAMVPLGATPAAAAPTAPPAAAVQPIAASTGARTARTLSASGSLRASAIPMIKGPRGSAVVAKGQSTYRQVAISAKAAARTIAIPPSRGTGAARVEVYAVQPYRQGRHTTQVLVPVSGTTVKVPKGATVRFVVRVTGRTTGAGTIDAGVTKVAVRVTTTSVRPLPMMTWVNPASATKRGASVADVERTLAGFGVSSTGKVDGASMPRTFVSAAWEAANKQPIGPVADRILAAERERPGSTVWVQVSDEQDTNVAQAATTTAWIRTLDSELERRGSTAKLFAACQPRAHTLAYAHVLDGWAVTQSDAGMTRAESIRAVRAAGAANGRKIELMEYPGNAFLDGETASSAALSTASAALDGAGAWFLYSANNLDVLETGSIASERGDIGGLVTIKGGQVLPTLALAEAHYGANLGAAARAVGGAARTGAAAQAVRASVATLDQAKAARAPDLLAWENAITPGLR